MPIRYCEFQPTQHRNKRTASLLFLDDEHDKHPMAICDICSIKLKQMNPKAILKPLHAKKAKAEGAPAPAGEPPADKPET